MAEQIDENPIESEENTKETPSNEQSPEEIWAKLTDAAPTPAAEAIEVETAEPAVETEKEQRVEKTSTEPDPLANDPKLVKRFRDSQNFIATLKSENKSLTERLQQLETKVQTLSESPAKQPEAAKEKPTQTQVNEVFADLMDQLPTSVKEEVETFPELFKGIDMLIKHRLTKANQAIEGELEDVRKQKHERYVQQKLNERHALANKELGITNAATLDLDDSVFAQWVLSSPSRKNAVLDFENTAGFVDIVRSFLFDYPDLATKPEAPAEIAKPENPKRKAASHALPSRSKVTTREPKRLESDDDKLAFWQKLTAS